MSDATATLEQWIDAFAEAMIELAQTTLGFEESRVTGTRSELTQGSQAGAYLPLICTQGPVQLGIVGAMESCEGLARALLGMGPEDEALSAEDLADALGEVINIAAGSVKSRLGDRVPALTLGLPMFVIGRIQTTEHMETAVAETTMGPITAELVVIRPKSS